MTLKVGVSMEWPTTCVRHSQDVDGVEGPQRGAGLDLSHPFWASRIAHDSPEESATC